MKSVLIIGAGISGLIIGEKLSRSGFNIKVVDKGNDIGGRLATKRIKNKDGDESVFDFGAQYFTARDERFLEYVLEWKKSGVLREWFYSNDESKYIAVHGMRQLAKELAKNLDVKTKTKIEKLSLKNNLWQATDADMNTYEAEIIVVTSPVQQSLDLIRTSNLQLPESISESLQKVSYHKCIAGLVTISKINKFNTSGYQKSEGEVISWIADNYSKGISKVPNKFTIHTTPQFSEEYWSSSKEELKEILSKEIGQLFELVVEDIHIHKWKYSLVDEAYKKPFEIIESPLPIILAGDGFVGGRIESAAISGIEAAEYMIHI